MNFAWMWFGLPFIFARLASLRTHMQEDRPEAPEEAQGRCFFFVAFGALFIAISFFKHEPLDTAFLMACWGCVAAGVLELAWLATLKYQL